MGCMTVSRGIYDFNKLHQVITCVIDSQVVTTKNKSIIYGFQRRLGNGVLETPYLETPGNLLPGHSLGMYQP